MAKECYLIRHGETLGQLGIPSDDYRTTKLTPKGQQQSEEVLYEMKRRDIEPALIVYSPFIRTKLTAEFTIVSFPRARSKEWTETGEFTFLGQLHGKNNTIEERKPAADAYWALNDPTFKNKGSESFQDFTNRAEQTITRMKEEEEEPIVVFAHGQFIQVVLWMLCNHIENPVTPKQMDDFVIFRAENQIPNASLILVNFEEPRWEILFTPESAKLAK